MIEEDEKTISKYNYPEKGVVVTEERLILRGEDSVRSIPLGKINSFYVYPKRGFLGKKFVVFANLSDEEDVSLVDFDERAGAVNLKCDLNAVLDK